MPAVADGSCILLLGPGTVTGTLDGESLPAHVAFAKFALKKLASSPNPPPRLDVLSPRKPGSIAQVLLAQPQHDVFTLAEWIHSFYGSFEVDKDVLCDLAALPFPLALNTSPGTLVYDAFAETKPQSHKVYYEIGAQQKRLMPEPSAEAPVVYHCYGLVNHPRSMILSDSDQLDFVVAVAKGTPPLPVNLTSSMRDENRTLLFLGFDLTDWQFRILLHVLSSDTRRRIRSFAFDLEPNPVDPAIHDFYHNSHKIHFFHGKLPNFVGELRHRVEEHLQHETTGNEPPPLHPAAPVAFISHASEDRSDAERIAAELRDHGVRPWLDQHELKGGDQWDQRIRETIHRVDYFVVLQSSNLMTRSGSSYVNLEINLARDRQKMFPTGGIFVIPALLHGEEFRRDDLAEWQSVDLATPNGLSKLVRTIKRDSAKRQSR